MPHLDRADRVTRSMAAELAERDRDENEARIREQLEGDPRRGCQSCGDPYAAINADGKCDLCERDAWVEAARDKLSPEELYPEHFPEDPDPE